MIVTRPFRRLATAALVTAALVVTGCAGGETTPQTGDGTAENAPGSITVGSANFPESVMLANMYALALEDLGMEVTTRTNIGAREVYFPALLQGDLDLLPEYTGSLLAFVSDEDVEVTSTGELVAELRERLEPEIRVLEPSEAQNSNGWAVTRETAERYDLETLSDLAEVTDELVAGGAPESRERFDGLPGLERVYDLRFADFVDLDPGGPLTAAALQGGDIDVARVFTSQGVIAANDWVVLADDRGLFPAENIVPVIRADALTDEVRERLEAISAALTLAELTELNRRVEVDNEDPDLVAEEWLIEQGLIGG